MAFAVALGLMAAGAGMKTMSAYRQGQAASNQAKQQANISDYNSRVADANAEAIKQQSIFDQVRALKAGERRAGQLTAKLGSSGAVVSEGAPADILSEQAYENALDVALIGHEGLVGAAKQRNAAQMYRNEAVGYKAESKNLLRAGKMKAWSEAFGGIGNMFLLSGFGSGGGASGSSAQLGGQTLPSGGAYQYGSGQQWRSSLVNR